MLVNQLAVGMQLPPLRITITPKKIIMGAAASRDWQPQHHDTQWAQQSANLPNIIMNNYTQAGWISRYITDWSGAEGRIGRLRFSMRQPICPGDDLLFSGTIKTIEPSGHAFFWLKIDIEIAVAERVVTSASVRLALPASADAPSVWRCPASAWKP
jgi:3-oxo-4,17-pregnadiene-20-carboxyl-CoA hydratase beta subunit